MRHILFLIIFLSFNSNADEAKIVGWNLAGFYPIPTAKISRFATAIEKIDPDVILLVEVNKFNVVHKVAKKLNDNGGCYNSAAPRQERAGQEIALLTKCSVSVFTVGTMEGTNLEKRGYRDALIADMKIGEFDFILVGLHLKASRGNANRKLRDKQIKEITNYLDWRLKGNEKDVIILGDFNMIPLEDISNFKNLGMNKYVRFISSESLSGQFSHIKKTGSGNLLDGYGITKEDDSEYIEDSIEIIQLHQDMGYTLLDYREKVSDHLPVSARFNIDVDDD